MIHVFGLAKSWDFPDASPYVCKLVMWLRLVDLDYDLSEVMFITTATLSSSVTNKR